MPDLHAVAAVSQVEQGLDQGETPPGGDLHVLQVWLNLSGQDHCGGS